MEYNLEQLKAMAYDTLVKIEQLKANLTEINTAINNYKETPKEEKVDKKVK